MNSDGTPKKSFKAFVDGLIKPLNKQNALYFYSPVIGLGCYGLLSAKVMDPTLIAGWSPAYTNGMLITSICGTSMFMLAQKHVQMLPSSEKYSISIYGGFIHNFGMVLFLSLLRSYLPDKHYLGIPLGMSLAALLAFNGYKYVTYAERSISKKE